MLKPLIFILLSCLILVSVQTSYKIVFLVKRKEAFYKYCAGAVLSKNWVISFCPSIKGIDRVVLGNQSFAEKSFKVLDVIDHEDFKIQAYGVDEGKTGTISYFTTKHALTLYKTEDLEITGADIMTLVTGWCCDEVDLSFAMGSQILKYARVTIKQDHKSCEKEFMKQGLQVDERHFCVDHSEHYRIDDCCNAQGILHSKNQLIGLTAWGTSCQNKYQKYEPFVFTNLTYYIEWIRKKTGLSNI